MWTDIINSLTNTPLPIILVVSGLFFLFLAIGGQFGAKVVTDKVKQKAAGVIGVLLLIVGLGLWISVPSVKDEAPVPENEMTVPDVKDEAPAPEKVSVPNVPNVIGKPFETAQDILSNSGLGLGKVGMQKDKTVNAGVVLAQTPRAGEKVSAGQGIDLVIAEDGIQADADDSRVTGDQAVADNDREILEDNRDIPGRQQKVLPDLFVSEFSLSPNPPVQRSRVSVSIGVYNKGNKASGPFMVEWWAGENFPKPYCTWEVEGLPARGGRVLKCIYEGYTSWYGKLTTLAVVDPKDKVEEEDEINNKKKMIISVSKTDESSKRIKPIAPLNPPTVKKLPLKLPPLKKSPSE